MNVIATPPLNDGAPDLDAPALVASLPLVPGGVDPLGLRQLNFNIMDQALPGINNVASRLRVYVLLAWAWWKAAELAKIEGGAKVSADRLRAYVDRMEVLFAVSHLRQDDFFGFVGRDTLNARVVRSGGFDFSGAAWAKFRKDRELVSSLMAPVAYGPSAKSGLGLAVIAPHDGGVFVPVEEVMPAVRAFDDRLSPVLDEAAFNQLDGTYVSVADMDRYYPYWRAGDLTHAEVKVGQQRLRDRLNVEPRRKSIDLIRDLLHASAVPMTARKIRRVLGGQNATEINWVVQPELENSLRTWRALQTRQLFRLALESLLNWVISQCAVPHHSSQLALMLHDALGRPNFGTVADWINSKSWPDGIDDPIANPVLLIEALERETQSARPDLAVAGLKAALQIARAAGHDTHFGGQADRLPLKLVADRTAKMAQMPFELALETMITDWVIGQHVYWAVGRSGDDTQRLRLMLDEGGWLSFFANPGNARATPDRLETVLRLMADCAMLLENREADEPTYASCRIPC